MLLTAWLQNLDKRLSERERALEADIASHRSRPAITVALYDVTDRKDEAQATTETQVADAEMVRDLNELMDVKLARERIVGGSYGLCLSCGAEIHPARLEAQPTALRCLSCQSVQERSHRAPAARVMRA